MSRAEAKAAGHLSADEMADEACAPAATSDPRDEPTEALRALIDQEDEEWEILRAQGGGAVAPEGLTGSEGSGQVPDSAGKPGSVAPPVEPSEPTVTLTAPYEVTTEFSERMDWLVGPRVNGPIDGLLLTDEPRRPSTQIAESAAADHEPSKIGTSVVKAGPDEGDLF